MVGYSTGTSPVSASSRRIACSCTAGASPGAANDGETTATRSPGAALAGLTRSATMRPFHQGPPVATSGFPQRRRGAVALCAGPRSPLSRGGRTSAGQGRPILGDMARYLVVHPVDPQPRAIAQTVAVLREGGLIAYPDGLRVRPRGDDREPGGQGQDPGDPPARRPAPLHAHLPRLRPARTARARGQLGLPGSQGVDARAVHVHPAGHPRGAPTPAAPEEADRGGPHPRPPRGACPPRRARRTPPVVYAHASRRGPSR